MKRILFIAAFFISSFAFADTTVVWWIWSTSSYTNANNPTKDPTADGACTKYIALNSSYSADPQGRSKFSPDGQSYSCWFKNSSGFGTATINKLNWCANGSAPVQNSDPTKVCSTPPPTCTSGTKSTFDAYIGSGAVGASQATFNRSNDLPTTDGSCNVRVTELTSCYSIPSSRGKDFFCTFVSVRDGSVTPSGSPAPDVVPPADKSSSSPADSGPKSAGSGGSCPAGTVSLGIDSNGGMICGGKGTSPTTPPKTEVKQPTQSVTNADGSTTKTDVTTRSNSDGSSTTTTTTTTTGTDGKVTSTTTQTTSDRPASSGGGAGKSDSGDDKKNDLCAQHPELNLCKNSTVTGECESTACEGDAIQCAILRQERKQYCELSKTNDVSTLGDQVLKGNDPVPDPFKSPTAISTGSFDSTDLFGAHQCPQDAQIQLWQGNSFSISYKPICDFASMVRPFVISGAAAGALWFVFGGL